MSAADARPRAVPPARMVAPLLRAAEREIESTVRGESMGDTLPAGARILIRGGAPVRLGAIVAFVAGESLVAHRLIHRGSGRGGAYLVTQGDGRTLCDPPIETAAVLGVVTAWRMTEESPWRPPAGAPRRGPAARSISAAVRALVRAALAVDVRAALVVTGIALTVGGLAARVRSALLAR